NGRPATPAERARLAALAEQFDRPARSGRPPSSGWEWIAAAIAEAVESGSEFVAPRRIARICERWDRDGFASPFASSRPGAEHAAGESATIDMQIIDARDIDTAASAIGRGWSGDEVARPSVGAFRVFSDLPLDSRALWVRVREELRRALANPVDRGWLDQ